jgi:hypothetical protein
MPIGVIEGFDGLGSYSELPLRSCRSVGTGFTYSSTGGRRGGGCLVDNTTGSTTARGVEFSRNFFDSVSMYYSTPATQDVEIGLAIKIDGDFSSLPNTTRIPICSLWYSATEMLYWTLTWQSSLQKFYLQQLYPPTPTVRVSAFGVYLTPGEGWRYLTFLVSGINSSSASINNIIAVDNIQSGSFTTLAINSAYSALGPSYLKLGVGNGASGDLPAGCTISYDDVFFAFDNGTGELPTPAVNSSLGASVYTGPVRIDKVVGVSDNTGFDDEFVPSAGSDEYPMLDEAAAHDGDTTYVESSTVGHTAQGGWNSGVTDAGLPYTPANIVGVRAFAVVKNTGDGSANCRAGLASNTIDSELSFVTRTIPAGSDWYGLTSLGSSLEGAKNTSGTLAWDITALRLATPLLEYTS